MVKANLWIVPQVLHITGNFHENLIQEFRNFAQYFTTLHFWQICSICFPTNK